MTAARDPWILDAELLARWRNRCVGAGALLLAVSGGAAFLWPDAFLRGSLLGFLFWTNLSVGCLAWLMLQFLTGGRWGLAIRRFLEAGAEILPVCLLFAAPVLVGLPRLYPWTDPEAVGPVVASKLAYLNTPFFLVRTAFYLGLWIVLAQLLVRWSRRHDRTGDERLLHRLRSLSGPGIVAHGLVVTFASVDWAMSLEPGWFSTGYGVIWGAGQALGALCFGVLLLYAVSRRPPFAQNLTVKTVHDLGNLMLAIVMFWSYVAFAQYLIIWSGNLPEEIVWIVHRTRGAWLWVAVAVIALHFFGPFLLLLSRSLKDSLRALAWIAGGVLVMRYVDLVWNIVPAFQESAFLHPLDVLVPLGMGGLWLGALAWRLQGVPLVPRRDPLTLSLSLDGEERTGEGGTEAAS